MASQLVFSAGDDGQCKVMASIITAPPLFYTALRYGTHGVAPVMVLWEYLLVTKME